MNPIYIHKGDCTIFADVKRFLTFNIETDLDLTGWKVKFILGWITKEIEDISSKSFEIILDSQETNKLRKGSQCGSIILTDAEGHIKTIANNIPFVVTTDVVENEYQEIDLTIPQSSGVDVKLKVGVDYVTSVNGMTGDVVLDIPSIEGLATEQQLQQGLNTKQDKGDYATNSRVNEVEELIPDITPLATKQELTQGLNTKQNKGNYALVENVPTQVSQLENDSQFATQTQVMQAIASIPQFSISLVDELPLAGEKMTLYLVSKGGESPDVYDEYIWIEQTSSFEFLGTTAVDLTGYVKNTNYANSSTGGVFKTYSGLYATAMTSAGFLYCQPKSLDSYKNDNSNMFVAKGTLENIKNDLVKRAITENDITLTADEQTNARTWLGAVGKEEYATTSKAGVIKDYSNGGFSVSSTGLPFSKTFALSLYNTVNNTIFISKGTLDNVLTQYKKCSDPMTQAEYEALETKDANTLYLIEE